MDDDGVLAGLNEAGAERRRALTEAIDALLVERPWVEWCGGAHLGGLLHQACWPKYSPEMTTLLDCLYAVDAIVPFGWTDWYRPDRFPDARAVAAASLADCVRLVTSIVRGERFCDGAIDGAMRDGTFPAALRVIRTSLA